MGFFRGLPGLAKSEQGPASKPGVVKWDLVSKAVLYDPTQGHPRQCNKCDHSSFQVGNSYRVFHISSGDFLLEYFGVD